MLTKSVELTGSFANSSHLKLVPNIVRACICSPNLKCTLHSVSNRNFNQTEWIKVKDVTLKIDLTGTLGAQPRNAE